MKSARPYGLASIIVLTVLIILSVFNDTNAETKLTAFDGTANDLFGISVAISGDTAVIGANHDDDKGADSGSAYVYVRDTITGVWSLHSKLRASDGAAGDVFGIPVAISGDTAVIGAAGDDDNGSDSGSAYVFVRDPDTGNWIEQPKLLASDGAANDIFGISVAISGNTAVIGAVLNNDKGTFSGSAYVFVRDPATGLWSEQDKLLASDGAAGDSFGGSVAISGNTAVIGASGDDDNGADSGSAYVFVRDPAIGSWSEQAKLTSRIGIPDDAFGASVAISGDTVVIGADGFRTGLSGSAFIFKRDHATNKWNEQARLTASDGTAGDLFGDSVAISGNTAIVGARADDDNGTNSGSTYVFMHDPATGLWNEKTKLLASDGAAGDSFGNSVAISGDTAVIGAVFDDDKGTKSGSAYVYKVNPLPDIKVNAEDGTVTLTRTDNLSVTVALDPVSRLNDNADWWVAARVSGTSTIDGWYYFDLSTLRFVPAGDFPFNLIVTHQGPLFNLPAFGILNIPVSVLPPGTYTFYFAVETNMNGTLDLGPLLYFDFVEVVVT